MRTTSVSSCWRFSFSMGEQRIRGQNTTLAVMSRATGRPQSVDKRCRRSHGRVERLAMDGPLVSRYLTLAALAVQQDTPKTVIVTSHLRGPRLSWENGRRGEHHTSPFGQSVETRFLEPDCHAVPGRVQ